MYPRSDGKLTFWDFVWFILSEEVRVWRGDTRAWTSAKTCVWRSSGVVILRKLLPDARFCTILLKTPSFSQNFHPLFTFPFLFPFPRSGDTPKHKDKTTAAAVKYWFRILDLNGDGMISMFEIEIFYNEQVRIEQQEEEEEETERRGEKRRGEEEKKRRRESINQSIPSLNPTIASRRKLARLEDLASESLSFEDMLCQLLDIVRPKSMQYIT